MNLLEMCRIHLEKLLKLYKDFCHLDPFLHVPINLYFHK